MAAITWDTVGSRYYETGVDHGVLYLLDDSNEYTKAYAWNGLTSVNENPEGGEAEAQYADNIKYLELMSAEDYKFTIEAYTYPEEFAECDGTAEAATGVFLGQQTRKKFGFSYRTKVGNDVDGDDHAYKLHLVYGCLASPSDREYASINDSPEAITFSWEVSSTPASVTNSNFKPTSHITIDSRTADEDKLTALLATLYGGASATAKLPTPDQVITAMT